MKGGRVRGREAGASRRRRSKLTTDGQSKEDTEGERN